MGPAGIIGLGIGSQVIGGMGNAVSTWMTNRAQRKLAEYQYSKDLEMWHRQNRYNLPVRQMRRLEQAGINPKLLFTSQGGKVQNVAKEMPRYQAPQLRVPQMAMPVIMQTLNEFQDIQKKKADIDVAKSTKDLQDEKALTEVVSRELIGAKATGQKYSNKLKGELARYASVFAEMKKREVQLRNEQIKRDIDIRKKRKQIYEEDLQIRRIERQWRQKGMKGTDPIQWRMLIRAMENVGINLWKDTLME